MTTSTEPEPRIAHRASRGILVTLGGQWTRTLVQTASTVLLARILAPSDFGLLAMVVAIVGVADLLRDFGLSGAIVQVKLIDDALWRSLLWLCLALGIGLTLVVAAAAPAIAWLYGDPRLVPITLALAPGLLVNSLAMPLQTKLQRELRFGVLARIDVTSMVAGVIVSIATALLGFGVWALVLMQAAQTLYRLAVLMITVRPRFGRPHIARTVVPLIGTGGNIFGVQILNYAARNLDNVIVGRLLGASILGQYTRAYALFLLPLSQLNGPLTRVALPVLSRLQDEEDRYRRTVRSAVLVLGTVSFIIFAISSALAQPLMLLVLGPGWKTAGSIFAILGLAGVAQALGNLQGWFYISLGRTRQQLVYYLISRPIVIGSFFVGVFLGGVQGLALAYGVISMLLLIPGFAWAIKDTFVRASDIVLPALRPAAIVPFAYAGAWAVAQLPLPPVVLLVLGSAAGLAPVAVAQLLPAYRRDMATIVDFVRAAKRPAS